MAILADSGIRTRIQNGTIGCDPLPDWETQLQPASLDLRLGREFAIFGPVESPYEGIYDHGNNQVPYAGRGITPGKTDVERQMVRWTVEEGKHTRIDPGDFMLATTMERLSIPDNLAARVEGRSTLARLGLVVHITAGFIDPGFEGQITLEMVNHGPRRIYLHPGTRVCQICFEQMASTPDTAYQGKYQNQKGVVGSRTHLDEEVK